MDVTAHLVQSPALNLASSNLSCNFIAHCRIRASTQNVDALHRGCPLLSGLLQKKHAAPEVLPFAELELSRVNF